MLKTRYGSWANTAIRTALAFDAYFSWYYAWKKKCPSMPRRMSRRSARWRTCSWRWICTRSSRESPSVSTGPSCRTLPSINYKITQSILEVGDVEAFHTSPLEMQNAESKRRACSTGTTMAPPVPRFPRACRSVDRARNLGRRGSIKLQQE